MANIKQRAGSVHIRIGGNTQDTASMVASLPGGKAIAKEATNTSNPVRHAQPYSFPPLPFGNSDQERRE
jgi:hypothetical protein